MSSIFAIYAADQMSEEGGSITNAVAHVLNVLVQGKTFSLHCVFYHQKEDGTLLEMKKNTYSGIEYDSEKTLDDQVDAIIMTKFPEAKRQTS